MFKQLMLLLISLLSFSSTMAQSTDASFKIIRRDSIPLSLVDTVLTFWGKKVAVKDLGEYASFAGLSPIYPMRQWMFRAPMHLPYEERIRFKYFSSAGGLIPFCVNYMVLINGDTVVIDSHEKFRELFTPVSTPQEALAFAKIFTDSYPIYNLDFLVPEPVPETYIFYELDSISGEFTPVEMTMPKRIMNLNREWYVYLSELTSSYVQQTDDGYELLLYYYKLYGCSHPYVERKVKVFTDGRVEVMSERPAFEKREDHGLCID